MFNKLNLFKTLRTTKFIKNQFKSYSTKKHNTNFDYHLDWIINSFLLNKMTLSRFFFLINTFLFGYCWLAPNQKTRYEHQNNVSFSEENLRAKDFLNLLMSQLGSRRADDYVIDSVVLLTIGHKLENMYGSPLIFKISIFSLYLGILSSSFWVKSEFSVNSRYALYDPLKRDESHKRYNIIKYMSQHSISMTLLYFYVFKVNKALILPLFLLDMYIWGPVYSNCVLTGLGFGVVLL